MFRHHPNGTIFLNEIAIPLDQFLIDEPNYALPSGMIGREYDPIKTMHILRDGRSQHAGEIPYLNGDRFLANAQTYFDNWQAREKASLTLTQIKQFKVAELREETRKSISQGFSSSALGVSHHYPLSGTDQSNLQAVYSSALAHRIDATWIGKIQALFGSETEPRYRSHTVDQALIVGDAAIAHKDIMLSSLTDAVTKVQLATSRIDVEAITF